MKFKTTIWEQVTVWQEQEVFFEADNVKDAEQIIHEGNLPCKIYDYGNVEMNWETMDSTGNYDYAESILNIEKA